LQADGDPLTCALTPPEPLDSPNYVERRYWWPVYHALARARIEVCVCNAAHMRNVPGRKTDLRDCQWIAELHEYGLLRPGFIPAAEVAALPQRTRYRKRLVEARTAEGQRLPKVLEDAGIKIDSVASSLTTASARDMIDALVAGVTDDCIVRFGTVPEFRGRGALRMAQPADVRQHQLLVCDDRPPRQHRISKVVSQLGVHRGRVIDPRHPQRIGNASRALSIHLLQDHDVGIGQRGARLEHIDRAVDVFAPLDVVGDDAQDATVSVQRRCRRRRAGVSGSERARVIEHCTAARRETDEHQQ